MSYRKIGLTTIAVTQDLNSGMPLVFIIIMPLVLGSYVRALLLLVGRFVPTKIIRVRNKDKPWFDDQCRHAFSRKQVAHLRLTRDLSRVNWEEFSTVK